MPTLPLKDAKTFKEQISILKARGLKIDHPIKAARFLSSVNYYRFSGYCLSYYSSPNVFRDGTTFEEIQECYMFDAELRGILYPIICEIEIRLRTQIANYWGLNKEKELTTKFLTFPNEKASKEFMAKIRQEIKRNRTSPAVAHHIKKYGNRFPIWVAIEFFTMGTLSKFFRAMTSSDRKQIIGKSYKEKTKVLESWFQCLTVLRNRCAHHGRLYNWIFTSIPRTPKASKYTYDNSLFSQLMVVKSLYHNTSVWNKNKLKKIVDLCNRHSSAIDLTLLGFPEDWQNLMKKNHSFFEFIEHSFAHRITQ
ncbi:MAG: Abi family protein [Bacilli bacterium]|nr:Abi family protein [Bacilli bacterium]